ncbi:MAG TPA: 50S ribosomal protein L23 [Candidatus Saccharimonadales bacterium]|nr:50S ribosomal protein L23 [Candidatus Saccharimonadales bacterium]
MTAGLNFEQVLVLPVISEKSYASMAAGRYVFRCHPSATKIQIRRAIEEAFVDQKITVVEVNTINVRGKARRRSRGQTRVIGKSPDWKKAIVTLGEGQKIEGLFEGV